MQSLMLIGKPGNVWEMLPSDKRFIVKGILPHIILRRETGSSIGINQILCKLCLVVGQVPS